MDEDEVRSVGEVYGASANRYVEFVGTELSPATEAPIDRSLLAAFVELVKSGPGNLVADVGCGPGRVAAYFADQGLDVVGFDVSPAMLAEARRAHPELRFEEGCLDDLPVESRSLAGAACWYSIINTPPERLGEAFGELSRVLGPGGYLLLAFQAGDGQAVHRADAYGTGLSLTSYRHSVDDVGRRLEEAGFEVYATVQRVPELDHESTMQAFVICRHP